jgi:hypothetical protein
VIGPADIVPAARGMSKAEPKVIYARRPLLQAIILARWPPVHGPTATYYQRPVPRRGAAPRQAACPGGGGGPGAGRLRRAGVALRFWRNPHGIRESVESVSVESAISKKIKNDPTGNSVHVYFDSVNPESVT